MKDPKNEVLEYLQTDRTLLTGRNIYNQLPNKSLALQNTFARMTDTEGNRKRLIYELCKAVGVPERQMAIMLRRPLKKKLEDIEIEGQIVDPNDTAPEDLTPEERLLRFSPENTDYYQAKELLKELDIKPKSRSKTHHYEALSDARSDLIKKELSELPQEVKASIKLRDQFPFLRDKETPDALKLLVNDLITSYENFKKAQPKLHELLSEKEAKEAVDLVLENYIANKEAWAELEHFKETGNVLGKHPLFERLRLKEEISAMKTPELTKKIKSLGINIGRNKKKDNKDLVEMYEDLLVHAKSVLDKR